MIQYLDFERELHETFIHFREFVDIETMTGTIVGGQILKDSVIDGEKNRLSPDSIGKETIAYNESVKLWEDYVSDYFGFKPNIAHHPLVMRGEKHGTDVFVNTQEKKVFIVHRSTQSSDNEDLS